MSFGMIVELARGDVSARGERRERAMTTLQGRGSHFIIRLSSQVRGLHSSFRSLTYIKEMFFTRREVESRSSSQERRKTPPHSHLTWLKI